MGTETKRIVCKSPFGTVEKMGPLRGDGNRTSVFPLHIQQRVEKMGPLRGDGNTNICIHNNHLFVEKMGPLRGDGNCSGRLVHLCFLLLRREDGSPSWGRKRLFAMPRRESIFVVEKMGPLRGDGNSTLLTCKF